MKKIFYNETSLRIISVLIAILMWMYVVGIRNPTVEINFRAIPIQITNQTELEKKGLEVVNTSAKTADVKIKGRRSDAAKITTDNITVEVDGSQITKPGTYVLSTETSVSGSNITVSDVTVKSVEVMIDYMVSSEKPVVVTTTGTVRSGFITMDPISSVSSVTVNGPQQIVESIDHIALEVDIDNAADNVTQVCPVTLIDKNGSEISFNYLTLSTREISVEVPVYKTKQVPITPLYSQEFDMQVNQTTVTVSPGYAMIYGDADVIDAIETVETQIIDVNTFLQQEETTIMTELVLPENVYLTEPVTQVEIKITQTIENAA